MKAKRIRDYPNYWICDDGRIYNAKLKRWIYGSVDRDGYNHTTLRRNGTPEKVSIHRLVATAFCPNPNNYQIVNHKNENKSDNRAENLEWCTVRYNSTYGNAIPKRVAHTDWGSPLRKKAARANGKIVSRPVCQYGTDGTLLAVYPSGAAAHKVTGINHSNIMLCCAGKQYKTVGGYVWKYYGGEDLLAYQ